MDDRLQAWLARRRVALGLIAVLVTLRFSQPTWTTWCIGLFVATVGEAVRVWAAGHLEKSREVTRSGPYEFMRHPLYTGSAIMAVGIVIASRSAGVALVAATYMISTLAAAIRTEEAFLRRTFGDEYDQYRGDPTPRRFSWARAMRNREYRAVAGLAAGFALLALKVIGYL